MKKLLALLLAALLIFCMAACKKEETAENETEENKAVSQELTKDDFVYAVAEDGNYKIVDFTYTGVEMVDVVIPGTIGEEANQRPVTEIDVEAFKAKHNIQSVKIPETVTRIGAHAFYDCEYLTEIEIPASVTEIGVGAFETCSSLAKVTLNEGLLAIKTFAFASCAKLASVTLPESLLSIGDGAFKECDALTEIAIPASVISIGEAAFFGCDALATATVKSSVNEADDAFLSEMYSIMTTYLTESEKDAPETFAELKALLEDLGYYMGEAKDDGCKYIWNKNTNRIAGAINAADAELVAKCNAALEAAEKDESNPYVPASLNALELFLKDQELEISKLNVSVEDNKYSYAALNGFMYYQDLGAAIFANCPALTAVNVDANSYFAAYAEDAGYAVVVIEPAPEATPAQ